jgi:hypothetical protein
MEYLDIYEAAVVVLPPYREVDGAPAQKAILLSLII